MRHESMVPTIAEGLAVLNGLPETVAAEHFMVYCHLPVRRWAQSLGKSRPFDTVEDLIERANQLVGSLTDEEVNSAHDGLGRIGEAVSGDNSEARWSRAEAAGVGTQADFVAQLQAANEAYEARFGHVFLISATGLSGTEILAELHRRTGLSEEDEAAQVRVELTKLQAIRLPNLLTELATGTLD